MRTGEKDYTIRSRESRFQFCKDSCRPDQPNSSVSLQSKIILAVTTNKRPNLFAGRYSENNRHAPVITGYHSNVVRKNGFSRVLL